jgi:hypothetical protein
LSRPLLNFQDPGTSSGLLEALLGACESADRGGGIFAWVTVEGARLLLEAKTFEKFAKRSSFQLVVGVDSITDVPALEAVERQVNRLGGLRARAMLHELRPALFHPKLSWFVAGERLTLLTGSGNLTRGGLRTNWEAFTALSIDGDQARAVEAELDSWLEKWDDCLLELEDPRVRDRAARNSGRERSLKRREIGTRDELVERGGEGAEPAHGQEEVLVATIGRGGRGGSKRWTQANFPQRFYEGFFGAKIGTKRHVLFQPVTPDGTLGPLQSKESVEVPSQNYRFELTSMVGLPYPPGPERPIGVFVHALDGVFRYIVVMPDDPQHATVADFLTSHWKPSRELPRVPTTASELRAAWPESPLWRLSADY